MLCLYPYYFTRTFAKGDQHMIEKIQNIFAKQSSYERRNFLKFAGLTSLFSVFPTFKTKSAHARYILNRDWWKAREIWSTEDQEYKNVEYCIQHNLKKGRDGILWSNLDNRWRRFEIRFISF